MIPFENAFCINHAIDPGIQKEIIDLVVADGFTVESQLFWLKYNVRSLVQSTVPNSQGAQEDYFYRLDPTVGWFWENTPVTALVRPLITNIEYLFSKLTRVKIFVQKPGMEIPAHRDLVPGNEYKFLTDEFSSTIGSYCGIYKGHPKLVMEPNTRHSEQKYLNLKIPLSTSEKNHGKPFIFVDGVKTYHSSKNRFYFLNEYEIFHGCDPVDFYRGVIFVDGILDMKVLDAEQKTALDDV